MKTSNYGSRARKGILGIIVFIDALSTINVLVIEYYKTYIFTYIIAYIVQLEINLSSKRLNR